LQMSGIETVKALLFMLVHDATPQRMENEGNRTPCDVQSLLWSARFQGSSTLPHTRPSHADVSQEILGKYRCVIYIGLESAAERLSPTNKDRSRVSRDLIRCWTSPLVLMTMLLRQIRWPEFHLSF
jgi:hypothetical protein